MFVDSNSVAGESSLDRLACGLGGKTVLPHIIVTVPPDVIVTMIVKP